TSAACLARVSPCSTPTRTFMLLGVSTQPGQVQSRMTRGEKIEIAFAQSFVKNATEAVLVRTHLMREWTLRWVFVPLLVLTVLPCLVLFILDAIGRIAPMRDSLVGVIKSVLVIAAGGAAIGTGVGSISRNDSN
ncbi:MAG: hypothetical protein ACLQU2_32465, partial [Candidatus Binataceae bacterium]